MVQLNCEGGLLMAIVVAAQDSLSLMPSAGREREEHPPYRRSQRRAPSPLGAQADSE
jgi:hypothetical protein